MSGFIPLHPGEFIAEECHASGPRAASEFAACMKWSKADLNAFFAGDTSVTPEIAERLAFCLNTTPKLWLNMQRNYDARHTGRN